MRSAMRPMLEEIYSLHGPTEALGSGSAPILTEGGDTEGDTYHTIAIGARASIGCWVPKGGRRA